MTTSRHAMWHDMFCSGKPKRLILFHHVVIHIRQHIKRAQYQTVIWEKAHLQHIDAPTPASSGWSVDEDGVLVPVWSTLGPVSQSCLEFVYYKSCKVDKCSSKRCCCRSANLPCTLMCNCILQQFLK